MVKRFVVKDCCDVYWTLLYIPLVTTNNSFEMQKLQALLV